MTGTLLERDEVETLIAMDDAYLAAVNEDRQKTQESKAAEADKPAESAGKGKTKPAGKRAGSKRKR